LFLCAANDDMPRLSKFCAAPARSYVENRVGVAAISQHGALARLSVSPCASVTSRTPACPPEVAHQTGLAEII